MAVPVAGFPEYLVYEDGKIWSTKRNKFLKPAYTESGYASVELFHDGKSKRLLIHRLVAQAYIPNPLDLPQVNHKDENPRNNSVSNLEWCTAKYNMNYGNGSKTRRLKIDYTKPIFKEVARENGKKTAKRVIQLTKDMKIVDIYESGKEAARKTNIDAAHISDVCNGKRKSAGGFVWKLEGSEDLSLYQF